MSKKFLNRVVAAILMMAIISTMFLGGVVNAQTTESAATYTIKGETVKAGDTEGSATITFTSEEAPFAAVYFVVENAKYNTSGEITAENPLKLSGAKFVSEDTVMADGGEIVVPYVEFESEDSDVVIIEGNGTAEDGGNNRRYYTSLTVELTFTGTFEQWSLYFINLLEIQITNRGSDVWSANDSASGINYIHVCTYKTGDTIKDADEDHYKITNSSCRICQEQHNQIHLEDYEGQQLTTENYSNFYYPDAVNMTYNKDGTVSLNILIDQDRYVSGVGVLGDYEVTGLLVTTDDGRKFTQFTGSNGQAQQQISLITKKTHDKNCAAYDTEIELNGFGSKGCSCTYSGETKVDISAERAAEMGFDTRFGLRVYSFTGIPAADIADDFYFTLIGARNSNGNIHYGATVNFSVKTYCEKVISGNAYFIEKDKAEKDVAVAKALLNYGATAQQYFSNTEIAADALANSSLSGADKTLYSDINLEIEDTDFTDSENENAKFYGASLIFRANPSLKFYFEFIGDEYMQSENVSVKFTIGTEQITVKASEMQHTDGSGSYHAYNFTDIGVMQMRTPVSVEIMVGDESVQSGSYSIAGYVSKAAGSEQVSDKLKNATKAMLYYGDAIIGRFAE